MRAAVLATRMVRVSWRAIGEALGMSRTTAETKYGSGYERQRRYRERKRQTGHDAD